ncbi:FASCICLIN-like arabinogalactan protein 14 precursor [Perilla frutescens var. frutescens]|nr:FASCICLIN-like arabinogalactan protein 14 precursor [Perilla frutescens var. frutescens]
MKMSVITLSLLFSLSLLTYTTNAFDITQILNQYPDFSTFNSYLTQTNLAAEINARQTITVLVVDNAHAAPLSAKPLDLIKNILSVHVILDYFDAPKLQQLSGSSALVTTLFQATGLARGQQGFLNITRATSGSIVFGSAMPGSPLDSNLVKSVVLQPYNISVLQVSSAIIPQGIDGSKISSPPVTPVATATPPPPPPSVTPASSVTPATSTPVSSQTAPPTPATRAIPVPVPSTAPPKPSAVLIPSTAPPTSSSGSVPSTAPPKPSTASVPSTAPPTSSKAAPVPSSIPPTVGGPAMATTPSATPASTPVASAPGPALGPASAPALEAPTSEEPGTTPPAAGKAKGKSAGTTLDVGLAVVFTMVLSAFYLTSTI